MPITKIEKKLKPTRFFSQNDRVHSSRVFRNSRNDRFTRALINVAKIIFVFSFGCFRIIDRRNLNNIGPRRGPYEAQILVGCAGLALDLQHKANQFRAVKRKQHFGHV